MFGKGAMDDYVRRLGMHEAAPLPCAARSYTLAEARAADWRQIRWMLTVVVLAGLFYAWMATWARDAETLWWLWGSYALVLLFVLALGWYRLARRRGYEDPGIAIEVAEAAVTVIGPDGATNQSYAELVVPEVLSRATKSSRYFTGIVLESRYGSLRIDDDHYANARPAAGAILKRLDELGLIPAD